MPALTPQITLTANLESIIGGAAEAGYLRVTLCGFGPVTPSVPGTAMLADAGVPQMVGPQAGSTPISVLLFGNDVINPSSTFYEVSVLDTNKDVIQSQMYLLTGSGSQDLSTLIPYLPPYGFPIGDLAYLPCTQGSDASHYTAPSTQVIAVAYNGIFMPLGPTLPSTLSYTLSGANITLNFATELLDRIDALAIL